MLQVVCAIIIHQNKVLAAKRSTSMPHPGYWEFPGGKVEDGETPEECLHREIKEELKCRVKIQKSLPHFFYYYPNKEIEFIPFMCTLENTDPHPMEHEEIRWLNQNELEQVKWLPADIEIKDFLYVNYDRFIFKN
jgi:8-oxo-dGTP diphosphatase